MKHTGASPGLGTKEVLNQHRMFVISHLQSVLLLGMSAVSLVMV